MALPLGGAESLSHLGKLTRGSKVGEGDVELGALHVHIHPDEPLLGGQGQAGLHGVVKEVAQDDAQVQLGHGEFHRDVGVHMHWDVPGLGQRNLTVQNGIGHGVARLHHRIYGVQVRVQQIQIGPDGLQIPLGGVGLHGLDVVAVVVPPPPHLPVHVLHLLVVGVQQFPLVVLQLLIHPFG